MFQHTGTATLHAIRIALTGALALAAATLSTGCLSRRILIETEPSGAQVVVNQRLMGPGPIVVETADFGDMDLRVELPGYAPQWLVLPQPRPWWGYDPLLFLVEACPFPFRVERTFKVQLERQPVIDPKVLKDHAEAAAKESAPAP
ncbi:MAG TPA: PEGA domain-containing protein [Planctomycetota bacterium]|nr:PEGA domain-containing protein [Planctomycetota bacterium]